MPMAKDLEPLINAVRDRADIVSIIGRYLQLNRAGSNYKALCPFHREKTPSFFVNPERQYYHCFGCGAKGDVFRFIMDYEGKGFLDTLYQLAEELGIPVKEYVRESEEETAPKLKRGDLYEVNRMALEFFRDQLLSQAGTEAREYLKKRGLTDDSIEKFQLGYAPIGWFNLGRYLKSRAVDLELAIAAGLLKRRDSGSAPYDIFRHRVIFPIRDSAGRVCGFGGRALDPDEPAKYLNTPETKIFKKGRMLYGIFQAKESIRTKDRALLVEGYLDVIAMHQFGFTNTIAALGTSLTTEHAERIRRLTSNVTLLFDGDEAGIKAAERSVSILIPASLSAEIVTLPAGEDPDSLLKNFGAEALSELIESNKKDALTFWIERRLEKTPSRDPVHLSEISSELIQLFREIKNPLLRNLYIRQAAQQLQISEAQLRRAFFQVVTKKKSRRRPNLNRRPLHSHPSPAARETSPSTYLKYCWKTPAASHM